VTLSKVWEPLTIGSTTVNHRIMSTGHTQLYGQGEILSDRHVAYYRERARGGTALLVLEQQAVVAAGMAYHAACLAFEEKAIPQYKKLTTAVHEFGTKQFVQLFACGTQGRGTLHIDRWHPMWAASATPSIVYNEMPLVMEQEHIDELIRGFGISARNCREGGVDGVEIHAAHNQLVGEFLSPHFNRREDEWGGTLEKRCRLAIEVAKEIRRVAGSDYTLGMRMSWDEYLGPCGTQGPQSEQQIEILAATGLFDFFSISAGGYHTLHIAVAPMEATPPAFMEPFAAKAKEIVGERAKIFQVGRITDLETAERLLAAGSTDMVALTRQQIADPFTVRKAREGRINEITQCAGINFCVERLVDNREVTCALNPSAGREAYWGEGSLVAAAKPKNVLVVGAGPAGLRCASTAAARGHQVRVVDKSDEIGGNWNTLRKLPSRKGWSIAIDNLRRNCETHGVVIELGVEATPEWIQAQGADTVVIATGAHWEKTGETPSRPDRHEIPGIDSPIVKDAGTAVKAALADPTSLGGRVLIVDDGAGYVPFGLAELLVDNGIAVEIISPQLLLGEDLLKSLDMPHVFPRIVAKGVKLTPQTFVDDINGCSVTYGFIWGGARTTAEFDTVVIAMHKAPNAELYFALKGRVAELHRVGDSVAPRRPAAIIYEAEKLGREI
jgi:2,4-dienoyl-CoA reductase-like NADH-dependent reductase (Old Yellow Enzyme family)